MLLKMSCRMSWGTSPEWSGHDGTGHDGTRLDWHHQLMLHTSLSLCLGRVFDERRIEYIQCRATNMRERSKSEKRGKERESANVQKRVDI